MCLLATSALLAAAPYMPHRSHVSPHPDARLNLLPPVRAASPNTHATVVACPASIAATAIWMSAPAVPPPIDMLPVMRGSRPSSSPRRR